MATDKDISFEPKDTGMGDSERSRTPGDPGPPPEGEIDPQVRQLRKALEQMDKAEKAYKIYPPNSVTLKDFIDRAFASMHSCLEEAGSVQLSILPGELRYQGHTVFKSEMRETSLPFKLYEGGLRLIGFYPGLERSEFVSFLDVMKKTKDMDEDEDNVVTLLWEKDVAHITYLVMDRESDIGHGDTPRIPDRDEDRSELVKRIKLRDVSQRVDKEDIATELLPPEDVQGPGDKIFGLSDEDQEAIRKLLLFEERYVPLYDFVTLLFRIFRMEQDWDTFYEMAKILEKVLSVLAARAEYAICSSILREMGEFIRTHEGLSEDHRQVFAEVVSAAGSAEQIQEATGRLADADPEEVKKIFEFFRLLGPSSLPHLCVAITEQHEDQFMDLIADLGEDSTEVVIESLKSPNAPVVRTMLRILASGGAVKALDEIAGLLSHPDSTIRLEAIDTLATIGKPRAGMSLTLCLEDADPQVRKTALRQMVRLAGEMAFGPILRKIEAKEFISRPFFEKRDLMVFACKADSVRGVSLLQRILERNSFFLREKNNETRQCAALALGDLGTPEATEVLRTLQKSRNRVVRDACTLSLKKAAGKEVTRRLI